MWKSRCVRGDPIGCVGYGTWGESLDIVETLGVRRRDYLIKVGYTVRVNARFGFYAAHDRFPSQEELLNSGKDIAFEHLDVTMRDRNNHWYYLSAPEITTYHNGVFDDWGINRGFYGGSQLDGIHSKWLELTYCQPACDWSLQ